MSYRTLVTCLITLSIAACSTPAPRASAPTTAPDDTAHTVEPTPVSPCDEGKWDTCVEEARAKVEDGDETTARAMLRRGCDAGHANSCFTLAGLMQKEGPEAARGAYEEGCEAGSLTSCAQLGAMASFGAFGEPDQAKALAYSGRACNDAAPLPLELDTPQNRIGQVYGCSNLAHHYETGKGVDADLERAFSLWQWACDRRDVAAMNACSQVGYFYARGMGVEASAEAALEHCELGCGLGEAMGCCCAAGVLADNPDLEGERSAQSHRERALELGQACAPASAPAAD